MKCQKIPTTSSGSPRWRLHVLLCLSNSLKLKFSPHHQTIKPSDIWHLCLIEWLQQYFIIFYSTCYRLCKREKCFKAAIMNIVIWTMDQMTTCIWKVSYFENYHPILQLPSDLRSFIMCFTSLFWFYGQRVFCLCFAVFASLPALIRVVFGSSKQQFCKGKSSQIPNTYTTCPAPNSRQTQLETSWWTKWSI